MCCSLNVNYLKQIIILSKMEAHVSSQQIEAVRSKFLQELELKENTTFDLCDVNRIKTDDVWVKRFLEHHDGNENLALQMVWTTLTWRHDFKTNEINESNINLSYMKEGAIFSHGRDKDGSALLIFKFKKHVKGQVDMQHVQRCIVYWMERLEKQECGKPITIFFDMEGCGVASVDMELIKYIIALFKEYYPFFLNYILIFEMAWILNAVFKVIKTWLPEKAVQKIKFLKKPDLNQYIEPNQALKSWGGNSNYIFVFAPEDEETLLQNNTSNKKVHFADGSPMSDFSGTSGDKEDGNKLLKVNPSSAITFVNEGNELISTLELQNVSSNINITYKMKTTSPEKFRVRPSAGCLAPGAKAVVNVTLLPGFQYGTLSRDKFLVMSMVIDAIDLGVQELTELWKNTTGKQVFLHRLRCSQGNEVNKNGNIFSSSERTEVDPHHQLQQVMTLIKQMSDHQMKLETTVKYSLIIQLTILLVVLAIFGMSFLKSEIDDAPPDYCYKDNINTFDS